MSVRFAVNLNNKEFMDAPVEKMFETRAVNLLKRNNYNTVGDIVNKFKNSEELLIIKGMGAKTAKGIMRMIFDYYVSCLTDDQLEAYSKRLNELNQ